MSRKPVKRATTEQIGEAIVKFNGNVSAAATSLSVSRSQIYRRIKDDEELAGVLADQRECTLDELEEELFTQALNGNTACLIFALKTQGQRRGYIEGRKIELDGRWTEKLDTKKPPKEQAKYLASVLEELQNLDESDAVETTPAEPAESGDDDEE